MERGVIVYRIHKGGCLTGIWTNDDERCVENIFAECARKNDKKTDIIEGEYVVSWIDLDNKPTNGILNIVTKGNNFLLTWLVDDKIIFNGLGIMKGKKHLIVAYGLDKDYVE